MNRQQAEHILDAYVRIRMNEGDKEAADSLRAVILDAMTEYKASTITVPNITYPSYPKVTYTDNSTNWDDTISVTCSGIDNAYRQSTGGRTS